MNIYLAFLVESTRFLQQQGRFVAVAPKAQCYRGWCRTSCIGLHSGPADLDLEDVRSQRRLHTLRGSSLILQKCKFSISTNAASHL